MISYSRQIAFNVFRFISLRRIMPRYKYLILLILFCLFAGAAWCKEPPFKLPPQRELQKIRSAIIQTNKGTLVVKLFPNEAPWHVANFKYLADKGFYNNLPFHIFAPGLTIQTGAPGAKLNSGPGYTIPAEFNNHKHLLGALSMVRKPNDLDYDYSRRSHGSQFRIMLKPAPFMDGKYSVFGQVVNGFEVLPKLRKGDTVEKLVVYVSH